MQNGVLLPQKNKLLSLKALISRKVIFCGRKQNYFVLIKITKKKKKSYSIINIRLDFLKRISTKTDSRLSNNIPNELC